MERRREFRQGMLAAYFGLKKAFDLVLREVLWDLQHFQGTPARIICLLTHLYCGNVGAAKCKYKSEAGMHACSITF